MAASTGYQPSELDLVFRRGDAFVLSLRRLDDQGALVNTANCGALLRVRTFDKKRPNGRDRTVLTADKTGGPTVGTIQVGIQGSDPQSNLSIVIPANLTETLPAIPEDEAFELRYDLRVWELSDENGTKTTWLEGRVIVRDW